MLDALVRPNFAEEDEYFVVFPDVQSAFRFSGSQVRVGKGIIQWIPENSDAPLRNSEVLDQLTFHFLCVNENMVGIA